MVVIPAHTKLLEEDRHHPALDISLSININNVSFNSNNKLKFDYKKCNFDQLKNLLCFVDWNQTFLNCNINEMCFKFYSILFDCFYQNYLKVLKLHHGFILNLRI